MGFGETGRGSGEVGPRRSSRAPEITKVVRLPRLVSPSNPELGRRVVGLDGTVWVRKPAPRFAPNDKAAVKRRRRELNTQITYVCEAASKKTGHSAAYHAGVPESTFREWRKKRNFVYGPPYDVDKAIVERMALDGYILGRRGDGRPLAAIVDAAKLASKLASLAHGIPHDPC